MANKQSRIRKLFGPFTRLWATARQIVTEHREYRVQIFQLAAADIIKTYRGSALGWAWAVIKPSVTIFVYWFAFAIGLRAAKTIAGVSHGVKAEYPFFLWLIAGIVPWFYINEMLTQGTKTLNRYNYLVTKIKFPVSTISTFVSLSKLYVHMALVAVVAIIFLAFGYPIDIYFIQLPFYMALMFLFFTAWSLFAAPLAAVSKDFANVVNSFIMAIFWLSGILWDAHKVDIVWLRRILLLNPVTYIANGYRNVFVYKRWFFQDEYASVGFAFVLLGMLTLALYTYHRLRREIADVL